MNPISTRSSTVSRFSSIASSERPLASRLRLAPASRHAPPWRLYPRPYEPFRPPYLPRNQSSQRHLLVYFSWPCDRLRTEQRWQIARTVCKTESPAQSNAGQAPNLPAVRAAENQKQTD